jgi:hypothetical protein
MFDLKLARVLYLNTREYMYAKSFNKKKSKKKCFKK